MLQPKIIEVKPLNDYKLFLLFETGEKKMFDVTPYISGSWYEKLKDVAFFNTVHVSGNTVEWAGGQDIAPHELYEYSELMTN
ncbi:MAG: DUF2442 domain-containing protein [Clostridiales bacterium]|jgi:hypothetical protein|nr:DUF2442 domain-containing protein [Clostridiales bacterium]